MAKTKDKTEQRFDELEFKFSPKEEFQDDKFCKRAASLREEGKGWNEIAEEMSSDKPTVSLAAHVHEEGRLMFRSQKELARQVQRARDAGEAWARIGARAGGLTEGRVQSLYEEATETPAFASYIGKGGRPRTDGLGFQGVQDGEPVVSVNGEKPKAKKASKKASKKSKKKVSTDSVSFSDEPTEDEVSKILNGKTVTVARPGGKVADLEVEEVLKLAQNKKGEWGVKVKTSDGKEPAFALNKVRDVQ